KQMSLDTLKDSVGPNLGHLTHYILVKYEKDPKIRAEYLKGFMEQQHDPVKNDGNIFWNFLLASQLKTDPATVQEWVDQFNDFPTDKYWERKNSDNPQIPKFKAFGSQFFKHGEFNWFSYEPLPLNIRPMHGFAWQNQPYSLDGKLEDAAPGVPFLAAYWLGRLHGFISVAD
ncbi:MAG: hypothetical protein AABZ55_05030, partial [Bdellovibrionota bacterium]